MRWKRAARWMAYAVLIFLTLLQIDYVYSMMFAAWVTATPTPYLHEWQAHLTHLFRWSVVWGTAWVLLAVFLFVTRRWTSPSTASKAILRG